MRLLNSLSEIMSEGVRLLGKEETALRIDACNRCDDMKKVAGIPTCSRCGCVIHLKARLAASTCPRKKWRIARVSEKS
jgi:hypothetical protein